MNLAMIIPQNNMLRIPEHSIDLETKKALQGKIVKQVISLF